jgi:hypothetical protein
VLTLAPAVTIHRCARPVDLRFGFDGLAGLVRSSLQADPLSGHLYVFFNKAATALPIWCDLVGPYPGQVWSATGRPAAPPLQGHRAAAIQFLEIKPARRRRLSAGDREVPPAEHRTPRFTRRLKKAARSPTGAAATFPGLPTNPLTRQRGSR